MRGRFALFISLFLLSFAPAVAAAGPTYTLTVVGPYRTVGRQAVALNDAGHVTGQGAGNKAFLYNGTLRSLGAPAGSVWSVGQGISNGDVVAATAQDASGVRHAYAVTAPAGKVRWAALSGLAGYALSEAQAITPDGSAIVGTLCRTTDRACAGTKGALLAAVWQRSAGKYGAPLLLPAGKSSAGSSGAAVARSGSVTVAAAGNTVWPLRSRYGLALTAPAPDTSSSITGMSRGPNNTFYVVGNASNPNVGTVTEALIWTVRCTHTGCTQINRQIIANDTQAFAVNNQGQVVGYSRPNEDGAGFYYMWQNGQMTEIPIEGLAINSQGQIAGPRQNPTTFRIDQVALLTPSS